MAISSNKKIKLITNFSEFELAFPNYSFLESRDGYTRYSNGEGENSNYESAWFDNETEELVSDPQFNY